MVATGLTGLLVAGALNVFVQQRKAMKSTKIVSETRQNVRTAIDMVSRDLRMAGYGLKINPSDLSTWIDWGLDLAGNPVIMDDNPKIVDSQNGSADAVWVAAAFDSPVAALVSGSVSGTSTLQLGNGEGGRFNLTDKRVIYIGKAETARIVSISGDTLTISTHPSESQGLQWDHPAGSVVELVKVRSYQWSNDTQNYPYQPYLTRDESIAGMFTYYWQRLIAAGITDFQVSRTGDQVDFSVTGKASVQDNNYFNGAGGSKHRTITSTSSVMVRNAGS
jgi:hypothetical protein